MIATKWTRALTVTGHPEWSLTRTNLAFSFCRLEAWTADALGRSGIPLMRVSLAVIFLWFGVLKFFPSGSPIQALTVRTISFLTFGLIAPEMSLFLCAVLECVIGVGLLTCAFLRAAVLLLLVQMAGTLLPLVFFPSEMFVRIPYVPTLEGQFILKNIVLITAALVVGREAMISASRRFGR
jgi:uncharacterized membrane protein YphA (DoxX/SURF4 family)